MKILKYIFFGLVGLAIILAIVPAFLSSKCYVIRTAKVSAPTDSVYSYMSDLNNFKQWSPWQELDPNLTTTVEGTGIGSKYSWKGNDQVGSGSMTIANQKQNKFVDIKLEFIEPFPSVATTKWSVAPAEGGAEIKWEMWQDMSYFMRYFGLMMDGMIGKDFDKGLGKLKTNIEK